MESGHALKEEMTIFIATWIKMKGSGAMLGLPQEPQAKGSTIFREENVKKKVLAVGGHPDGH